jgi:regulator of sigma D
MSEKTYSRPRTRALIEGMLGEREQMLLLLWKVSGRDSEEEEAADSKQLHEFTRVLVDYIAAGHFGLYERIIEGGERRVPVVEKAKEIYPRIAETTDAAIDLNDKHEGVEGAFLAESLPTDISKLSEDLVERIELEDQLIDAMLGERLAVINKSI